MRLSLKFQALDGTEHGPFEFQDADRVHAVSQTIKGKCGIAGPALPILSWRGSVLPGGATLGAAGLEDGAVIGLVQTRDKRPILERDGDVLPSRKAADAANDLSSGEIDFAGCCGVQVPAVLALISTMTKLKALDLRQCRLKANDTTRIFGKLSDSLEELRASRNRISRAGLTALAAKSLRLRVLDIGYSDCKDVSALPELVCERTEELVLGDLHKLQAKTLDRALSKCPRLRRIDLLWTRNLSPLSALSRHCPGIQSVQVGNDECPREEVAAFTASCRQLEELVLYDVEEPETLEGLSTLPSLDMLTLECLDASAFRVAANIRTRWLQLGIGWVDTDNGPSIEQWCRKVPGVEAAKQMAVEAFRQTTATAIGLAGVPVLTETMLEAVGPRLQVLEAQQCDDCGYAVLDLIGRVPQCGANLLELSVRYFEQIDPKVLASVAAACPLLENLQLNADEFGFQKLPIDEGVLAVGQHCRNLRHLDLYDRALKDAPGTLAKACQGWPKLVYLCAAGTIPDGVGWKQLDPELSLPKALATHCPELKEVVIYDKDAFPSWYEVLREGCPFILKGDEDDDDDDED